MTTFIFCVMSLMWTSQALLIRKIDSNVTMKFEHQTAKFGPQPGSYNATGKLVVSSTENGCVRPTNVTYEGSIVVVKRGGCVFSTKVLNAQENGALGVIVGNNNEKDEWVSMIAENKTARYTIPAVYVQNSAYNFLVRCALAPSPKTNSSASNGNSAPKRSGQRRILHSNEIWIAMLNEIGEVSLDPPTMNIWRFVGYLLLFIPTVWCIVTVILVIFRGIKACINRQRRARRVETIPLIEYTGVESEISCSSTTSGLESVSDNNKTGTEMEAPPTVLPLPNPVAAVTETSETKLLDSTPDHDHACDGHEHHQQQQQQQSRSRFSSFLLNSLSTMRHSPQPHNDTCAVCLEEFERGTKISLLPCRHGFHTDCITPWLKRQSELCPMCKQSIFVDDPGRSNDRWYIFKCCISRSGSHAAQRADAAEMIPVDDSSDSDENVDAVGSGSGVEMGARLSTERADELPSPNDETAFVMQPTNGEYMELPNRSLTREQQIVLASVRRMGL